MMLLRSFPLILTLLLVGCRAGRDPDRLLGRWEGAGGAIEFFRGGRVVLETPEGVREGSYARRSRDHIQVAWGGTWPSGEPQRWRAIVDHASKLAICELRNGRHCMQFHRPGRPVRITPR